MYQYDDNVTEDPLNLQNQLFSNHVRDTTRSMKIPKPEVSSNVGLHLKKRKDDSYNPIDNSFSPSKFGLKTTLNKSNTNNAVGVLDKIENDSVERFD